jgi:hypothetical protein
MKSANFFFTTLVVCLVGSHYTALGQSDFILFGEFLTRGPVWGGGDNSSWIKFHGECNSWGNYLRLNAGTLRVNLSNTNQRDTIYHGLGGAYAHNGLRPSVGIETEGPTNYRIQLFASNLKLGYRWLFHPECSWQFSQTGCVGVTALDRRGTTATDAPSGENDPSIIHVVVNDTSHMGYLARGLLSPNDHRYHGTGDSLFIRARIKREWLLDFRSTLYLEDTLCVISVFDLTNNQDLVRHPVLIGQVDSSRYVQSTAGGFPVQPGNISLDFRV